MKVKTNKQIVKDIEEILKGKKSRRPIPKLLEKIIRKSAKKKAGKA